VKSEIQNTNNVNSNTNLACRHKYIPVNAVFRSLGTDKLHHRPKLFSVRGWVRVSFTLRFRVRVRVRDGK